MSVELVLIVANFVLAVVALYFSVKVLRSTRGGMGGSWNWLVAALAVFTVTSLYRVASGLIGLTGGEFEIEGLSEILELVYIVLFLIGISTQVMTYRKLSKS